jgi:hypothetical protein
MLLSLYHTMTIKNYVLQTRTVGGVWQDYEAYQTLAAARRARDLLAEQQPELELRIFNRAAGRVVLA